MTEPKCASVINAGDWKKLFALQGSPETIYKLLLHLIGPALIWVFVYFGIKLYFYLVLKFLLWQYQSPVFILYFPAVSIVASLLIYVLALGWRSGAVMLAQEKRKFSMARWAEASEMKTGAKRGGLYVGGGYGFSDRYIS